jgi:hypothetical protein
MLDNSIEVSKTIDSLCLWCSKSIVASCGLVIRWCTLTPRSSCARQLSMLDTLTSWFRHIRAGERCRAWNIAHGGKPWKTIENHTAKKPFIYVTRPWCLFRSWNLLSSSGVNTALCPSAPHQRCQDTLSLYRDEKRERSHWSDVTEDYFAAWRLEAPFDPEHSWNEKGYCMVNSMIEWRGLRRQILTLKT